MKKILLSAVAPSGTLHLGNYLGAIKNWVELQDQYRCIFIIVDHHAITTQPDPGLLHDKTLELARIYLASGLDPEACLFFVQSHVSAHTELSWILSNYTQVAEMERMTQYKDKAERMNVNMGLMSYPMLMAADILLYDTHLVPVGEDQTQHLEFARTIGRRVNKRFGDVFIVPKQYTPKQGARIMGLDDSGKKMSKSAASPANYLAFTDDEATLRKKIMKAQTDSGSEVAYDPTKKPAVSNLMTIMSLLTGKTEKAIEKKYQGKGYGDFKGDLADEVVAFMSPFQKRMAKLTDKRLLEILEAGAAEASETAGKTLTRVKEHMGFVTPR